MPTKAQVVMESLQSMQYSLKTSPRLMPYPAKPKLEKSIFHCREPSSNSQDSKQFTRKSSIQINKSEKQASDVTKHSLCFNKLVSVLRRYFQQRKVRWNWGKMSYAQCIIILHTLGYVSFAKEKQFMEESLKEQEELKKMYWLWINLNKDQSLDLSTLLGAICAAESIPTAGVEQGVETLNSSTAFFELEELKGGPSFQFYAPKIVLNNEILKKQLELFKINKMCRRKNQTETDQQNVGVCQLSKKSKILAAKKRRFYEEAIRQIHPNIHEIHLHDILSYKEPNKIPDIEIQPTPIRASIEDLKPFLKALSSPKSHVEHDKEEQKLMQSEDYTFHPQIQCLPRRRQKGVAVKSLAKNITRLKLARHLRQEKDEMLKRGWTYSKKAMQKANQSISILEDPLEQIPKVMDEVEITNELNNLKYTFCLQELSRNPKEKKEYLDIPILFVDVNLDETNKERIVIYEGDTASKLAQDFGRKHNLGKEMTAKLKGMLDQQIGSILVKIEEEMDEESSYYS